MYQNYIKTDLPFSQKYFDCVQLLELGDNTYCLNNSITNKQVFLNDHTLEILSNESFFKKDSSFKRLLFTERFLHRHNESTTDLREKIACAESERGTSISYSLLRILLTDYCNLACDYCKVVQNVSTPKSRPVTPTQIDYAMQLFFENSIVSKPKIIHCTGGEPTVHWTLIEYIIAAAERYKRENENYWIVLGTNATLLNPEKAKQLAKHNVKCIVSMDGDQETHDLLRRNYGGRGSWKQVDRGIRHLKNAGAELSISVVFGKHNISRADEIVQTLVNTYEPTGLGVNFIKPPTPDLLDYPYLIDSVDYAETLYRLHMKWRDKGLFLELPFRKIDPFVNRYYRTHDCGAAGGTTLNLDSRGNLGPCKSFLVMESVAFDGSTANMKNFETLQKSWRRRSPIFNTNCHQCPAQGSCGNGCAYEAWIHNGNDMGIDQRSCMYTKRFHQLMIGDLFEVTGGLTRLKHAGWFMPSDSERKKLLGKVAEVPHTLSFSIGHHHTGGIRC